MARESLLYTWKNKHLASLVVMFIALVVGVLFAMCFSTDSVRAVTSVPTKMNFQGRLTDSSGAILTNGTYNMRFRIYSASSGGTVLWSEDRLVSASQGVTVSNGQFSVQLGDVTSLPASLFNTSSLYFEIELPTPATATGTSPSWTEGAMSPRNQLATSAYAFNSDTLDGFDSDDFAKVGGTNTFTGTNTFRSTGTSVFSIQDASGVGLLTADTTNRNLIIGSSTGNSNPTFLVVNNYNGGASDPAGGIAGATYYNTASGKFRCFENGGWKDCITSLPPSDTVVKLSSSASNSTTTLSDTGLTFNATSGVTYRFTAFVMYNSASTATGARITATGPTFSRFSMRTNQTLTATTEMTNYAAAYSTGTVTGTSLTSGNIATIQGRLVATATGAFKLQFASETSGSAITILDGSSITYSVE